MQNLDKILTYIENNSPEFFYSCITNDEKISKTIGFCKPFLKIKNVPYSKNNSKSNIKS